MNELKIVSDGIIGSKASLEKFISLKDAKILIISDTHRNMKLVLQIIKEHGPNCDALFYLGDGTGDIIYCLQLAFKDLKLQSKIPPIIFIVEGNLDAHNSFLIKEEFLSGFRKHTRVPINFLNFLFVKVCNENIMLTHGHLSRVKQGLNELVNFAKVRKCSMCFYGHTHRAADDIISGVRLINPGCLSKTNNEATGRTFMILTLSKSSKPIVKLIKC